MRTRFAAIVGVLGLLIASQAMAQAWPAFGIRGTPHDMTQYSWNNSGEICLPCHTPHDAMPGNLDAPLWNHDLSTATYTVYSSPTLKAAVGQPDGVAKMCLGCHDGTVAMDSFSHQAGSTTMMDGTTDWSNSHPISFVFDSALAAADPGLHDPDNTPSGLGGTITQDMLPVGSTGVHKVQCTSCHEPHNKYGNDTFLRINNAGSALCLTCHNK